MGLLPVELLCWMIHSVLKADEHWKHPMECV